MKVVSISVRHLAVRRYERAERERTWGNISHSQGFTPEYSWKISRKLQISLTRG